MHLRCGWYQYPGIWVAVPARGADCIEIGQGTVVPEQTVAVPARGADCILQRYLFRCLALRVAVPARGADCILWKDGASLGGLTRVAVPARGADCIWFVLTKNGDFIDVAVPARGADCIQPSTSLSLNFTKRCSPREGRRLHPAVHDYFRQH